MKAIKVLGVASLLALGAAFAAPAAGESATGELVQVVQAMPGALETANLSPDQARTLEAAIGGAGGPTITDDGAQTALDKIKSTLSPDQYQTLMSFASTEPQVILSGDGSNPLSAANGNGVNNATLLAYNFLDSIIHPG